MYPTLSLSKKLKLRLDRESKRPNFSASVANEKDHFNASVTSGYSQAVGTYFATVGLGSPPKPMHFALDTGSDLTWTQCPSCVKCYTQMDPIFDPTRSRSFRNVTANSTDCKTLGNMIADSPENDSCTYSIAYGDLSFSQGYLAKETITFLPDVAFKILFGCGYYNLGRFNGSSGIMGLGRGLISITNQIGWHFGSKFSYCLGDPYVNSTSNTWLMFGDWLVTPEANYTRLLRNDVVPELSGLYYMNLTGILIDGEAVMDIGTDVFKMKGDGSGGLIIDSGTTLTHFTQPAYDALRDAFRSRMKNYTRASSYVSLDTCYFMPDFSAAVVPSIEMMFENMALALPKSNIMMPVFENETYCLAFTGSNGGSSILGNFQQRGYHVLYDAANCQIGFNPKTCV